MSIHTLMFGWEFPPAHTGGLGVACKGLVEGLLRNGERVTLVLPKKTVGGGTKFEIITTSDSQTVIHVQSPLEPYGRMVNVLFDMNEGIDGSALYGPHLASSVVHFTEQSVALTRNIRPDVVHCHDWMTYEAGRLVSRHHGKPLIAHIHATELDRTDFHPNEWIMRREIRGLMDADKVIAVSNYTKRMLVAHYGIPVAKIAVVHNGTFQLQHNHITSMRKTRCPLVLFLGRMTVQKNPFGFLEIAKKVYAQRTDAQFVMAGEGEMLPQLLMKSAEMGLTNCVSFLGRVSRQDAQLLYRKADCFIMPSLSEPFGLVALEAASHGVPVIISKQSGVAEVLHHAFHVDFWDTDLMADCILTILREEKLASQMRSQVASDIRNLTWEHQARKVIAEYASIVHSTSIQR